MNARQTVDVRDASCPFAMPGVPSVKALAFYCRVPDGRVRIPDPCERRRYCLSGLHELCPIVRRYVRDR
jgi:hypothetical protein